MEARNIFRNISPLDHRYSISEQDVFDALAPWISEEASIAACVKAEVALVIAHLRLRGGADRRFAGGSGAGRGRGGA
jgi:adenylosuccinate lyase